MAKLIKDFNNVWVEDGKVRIPNYWRGIGWALMPMEWVLTPGQRKKVVLIGGRGLRILYVDGNSMHPNLYVVEANNRRWPIWWVGCRIWRLACRFERNLRATAVVWGFLRCKMGCYPRWRDFVLLPQKRDVRCQNQK